MQRPFLLPIILYSYIRTLVGKTADFRKGLDLALMRAYALITLFQKTEEICAGLLMQSANTQRGVKNEEHVRQMNREDRQGRLQAGYALDQLLRRDLQGRKA